MCCFPLGVQERVIVRCSCSQPDTRSGSVAVSEENLSLLVELNVSYRLAVTDTAGLPKNEAKVRTRCGETSGDQHGVCCVTQLGLVPAVCRSHRKHAREREGRGGGDWRCCGDEAGGVVNARNN